MDLNSTLSLLGLQPPNPSPHPGTSSGFCEICQKHVSNRTNHKFVHSHVSLFCCNCVEPAGVWSLCEICCFSHQLDTTPTGDCDWSGTLSPPSPYCHYQIDHLLPCPNPLPCAQENPHWNPKTILRPLNRNHHCRRRQPGLTRRVALAWQCAPLMTLVLFSASDQLVGRVRTNGQTMVLASPWP